MAREIKVVAKADDWCRQSLHLNLLRKGIFLMKQTSIAIVRATRQPPVNVPRQQRPPPTTPCPELGVGKWVGVGQGLGHNLNLPSPLPPSSRTQPGDSWSGGGSKTWTGWPHPFFLDRVTLPLDMNRLTLPPSSPGQDLDRIILPLSLPLLWTEEQTPLKHYLRKTLLPILILQY